MGTDVMGVEIERRFLVRDLWNAIDGGNAPSCQIIQGYFGCIDRLRVRVRIVRDDHNGCAALLTFKGARRGLCRLEFEYPLPLDRARRALETLPSAQIIRKTRYQVPYGNGLIWTVDRFEGANIRARRVHLCRASRVEGDILIEAFTVEAGAIFEGSCRQYDSPLAVAPAKLAEYHAVLKDFASAA